MVWKLDERHEQGIRKPARGTVLTRCSHHVMLMYLQRVVPAVPRTLVFAIRVILAKRPQPVLRSQHPPSEIHQRRRPADP